MFFNKFYITISLKIFFIMIEAETIKKRLSESIKESGINQSSIAKLIHVKQQTISHYVHGDIMPSLDTFANLCAVLDLDANEILCVDNN